MGNENSRIFQLKSLINNKGSIQKIWEDRILYHEYFTNVKGWRKGAQSCAGAVVRGFPFRQSDNQG